jgi:outer membrane immunogenic protein
MKKLLAAAAAAAALAGAHALAADLPVKAPVYKVPPAVMAYNWTGCYIGLNGGGAWQQTDNTLSINNDPVTGYFNPVAVPGVAASGTGSLRSNSFTGGVQIGCNYQAQNVVWGIETDLNYLRQSASFGGRLSYANGSPYFLNVSDDKHWLYTLRGRVGFAAGRALLYLTGGLAVTKFKFEQTFSEPPFTPTPETASISKIKLGFTVGAAAEAALWDNWTGKVEYLYARFSSETASGTLSALGATTGFQNSLSAINLHIIRLGVNYRF